MKVFALASTILSVAYLLGRVTAQESCAVTSELGYDFENSPDDGVTIYWTTPSDEISFKMVAEEEGYVSVGFSEDGLMVGADAVIALPEDNSVAEYDLNGKTTASVVLSSTVDISSTNVTQTDGITTLYFTRSTSPSGEGKLEIPDSAGSTVWIIWAVDDDNSLGHHSNFGSFEVDLFCDNTTVVDANEESGGVSTHSGWGFGLAVSATFTALAAAALLA